MSLGQLGPIGRRTHRAERRELERRIAGFETDIGRHDRKLADLEMQRARRTPEMLMRSSWDNEHSTDLDRLNTLDHQIDHSQQLERAVSRQPERAWNVIVGSSCERGSELILSKFGGPRVCSVAESAASTDAGRGRLREVPSVAWP